MSNPPRSTLEGLPIQFVQSLRVLYDILDEGRTGCVRLVDIEARWQDDGVAGLPRGVLLALRKVTPPGGKLSFERFVAGLKIALLRTKNEPGIRSENRDTLVTGLNKRPPDLIPSGPQTQTQPVGLTQPNIQHVQSHSNSQNHKSYGPTTATVRPNNAIAQQRTTSLPLLQHLRASSVDLDHGRSSPRPVRSQTATSKSVSALSSSPLTNPFDPQASREGIVSALKQWQREHIETGGNDHGENAEITIDPRRRSEVYPGPERRGPGDGRSSIASASAFEYYGSVEPNFLSGDNEAAAQRRLVKKKEPRRHTLANGIDYNMIKRMKQLEQERDILLQGLESVDRAHDWYHSQIQTVQDKQKHIGKTTLSHDYSVEAHEERMKFVSARVSEVNQQLKALVDSSHKGFPLHMNLAVSQSNLHQHGQQHRQQPAANNNNEPSDTDNLIAMLKAQNRLLTQDVNQKAEKIAKLEREKKSLIREIFEARSKARSSNYDDTTFM